MRHVAMAVNQNIHQGEQPRVKREKMEAELKKAVVVEAAKSFAFVFKKFHHCFFFFMSHWSDV